MRWSTGFVHIYNTSIPRSMTLCCTQTQHVTSAVKIEPVHGAPALSALNISSGNPWLSSWFVSVIWYNWWIRAKKKIFPRLSVINILEVSAPPNFYRRYQTQLTCIFPIHDFVVKWFSSPKWSTPIDRYKITGTFV